MPFVEAIIELSAPGGARGGKPEPDANLGGCMGPSPRGDEVDVDIDDGECG